MVYAKRPFAGAEQVPTYLSRYTHRIAISNRRLVAMDDDGRITFTWKDYRHSAAPKRMALSGDEFIRRFLLHVLPDGFQRIRHYGFLANGHRKVKLTLIRRLLATAPLQVAAAAHVGEPTISDRDASQEVLPCPCCGGTMVVIEILPGPRRRHRRLDSS